jgi:hypothetical protein
MHSYVNFLGKYKPCVSVSNGSLNARSFVNDPYKVTSVSLNASDSELQNHTKTTVTPKLKIVSDLEWGL